MKHILLLCALFLAGCDRDERIVPVKTDPVTYTFYEGYRVLPYATGVVEGTVWIGQASDLVGTGVMTGALDTTAQTLLVDLLPIYLFQVDEFPTLVDVRSGSELLGDFTADTVAVVNVRVMNELGLTETGGLFVELTGTNELRVAGQHLFIGASVKVD